MTTFSTILSRLHAEDAARPLVTFYDHRTGERTELSVATYANWVAKTASLLVEEYDAERGQDLRVDLPTHWLGPVFLGAAWTVGMRVDLSGAAGGPPAAVHVTGPDGLDEAAAGGAGAVLATALHPLGQRFAEPLPSGVHDYGVEVWSQPDVFWVADQPEPDDLAVEGRTQREVWETAAVGNLLTDGGRLLSSANPASPSGLACFTEPLVRAGSVVLLAHPDPQRVEATYAAERATARA